MNKELCSPFPPVLQFTPEVESGMLAAADLTFEPRLQSEPSMFDLEILAHDILRYTPELAAQLMQLGMEKLARA
ncbi:MULTISPECIES: hypothetical protein [Verrucomicrobium]|jgi:hypothetical protein|uniref:hypothetical protein n=1 Tax=Verrucomicrobium TaxID=2735 RepID=UPI000174606D|nr:MULTISPECIES: hypothetical protein [Verrucomicrobium]